MSKKLSLLIFFALLASLATTNTAFAAKPPPNPATNPNPTDQATDVSINADLSWTAGAKADSHDVYFGTSSPGSFQGNQTATTFDPGTMDNDETYYWRIDEINVSGTTTGTVWSFTTESAGGAELLTNPGFESGQTPWYIGDANQITISNEDPHSGTNSAKFVGNNTWLLMSQNVDPAQEGVTYDVSGWMKTVSVTTEGQIILQFLDSGWGIISESQIGSATSSTNYTQYSDSLLSPTGTALLRLRLVMPNGTGTIYYDDFSITEAGAGPPGQASNPSPANSATDVSITADLSWTAGSGATSRDVYFGTTSPGASQGNQTATTFDPGTMDNDETYYWRIDEINASGTTTGVVWSFTTEAGAGPPGQASSPSPANSATGVSLAADLSWTAGSGATSHDVYFGTTSPGASQGNQTATTFDPGTMDASTTYYWRIDEVNASGTTTGTVWSFTTSSGGGTEDVANADIAVSGTVSGSYTDTQSSNDTYESIEEIESGGKPSNRYTYLEHKWTINVTGGDTVTFHVEAYHTSNSEGDDFIFAYSTDDSFYTNMVTVTKTSDNDATDSYELPSSTSGTVYIRVKDADQTQGNRTKDTIYVDHMYILSEAASNPPGQASNPSPADTATDVSLYADLSWTAGSGATSHDVYFGTSSPGTSQGNQTATTFDPGTLDPNTTHYWRIDEINTAGTTTGTVWSFTTGAGGETSMLITSIENSTELGYWTSNGTMSLSTEHVTDGTYSLKIVF
ncbi:MAG: hypothetical protein ACYS1A_12645, partial [Planctomycetota bacterium]